ncbi:MAG: hypothetical protein JWN01_230 [Patescibacteria group bacterium]|nr:hypothetical protein [Patescibacteria group bacterium]
MTWPRLNLKISLTIAAIIALSAAAGIILVYRHAQPHSPFASRIINASDIPLYYPGKLPKSYSINYGSVSQPEKGITIFEIRSDDKPTIYISQQAPPNGKKLKLDTFHKNLQHSTKLAAPAGQGYIGQAQDGSQIQQIASLTTGSNKTWILMNTSANVPTSTLESIAHKLILAK